MGSQNMICRLTLKKLRLLQKWLNQHLLRKCINTSEWSITLSDSCCTCQRSCVHWEILPSKMSSRTQYQSKSTEHFWVRCWTHMTADVSVLKYNTNIQGCLLLRIFCKHCRNWPHNTGLRKLLLHYRNKHIRLLEFMHFKELRNV